jgi:hypothetical protein
MVEVFSHSSISLRYNTSIRFDRFYKIISICSSPIFVPFGSIIYTMKTIENTTDNPPPFSVDIMPQYSSLSASCLRKGTVWSYTHTHTHTHTHTRVVKIKLAQDHVQVILRPTGVLRSLFNKLHNQRSYFLRVTVQVQHCHV